MIDPTSLARSATVGAPAQSGPALGKALLQLACVLLLTAACLRAVDALPGLLRGSARGVRHFESVAALERAIGLRVPLPSYFPDALSWPPRELRAFNRSAATLLFVRRDTGVPWLLLGLASGQNEALPSELDDGVLVLQEGASQGERTDARVRRLRDEGGTVWNEIAWRAGTQYLMVRSRGPMNELERIAASVPGWRR